MALALIGSGLTFIGATLLTGASFAAGATAFTSAERAIQQKIAESKKKVDPDAITSGDRRIIDNNDPFAENRFLDHVQRRELSQTLLKELK